MKTMGLAVFLLICASCYASETCQTTYQAKNQTQLTFCITENGNVVSLEGPPGYPQIVGVEGYAVCAVSEYYDLGQFDSGNWGQSVITQPKGPNTFPLTIVRATQDGKYTLTQIFNLISAGKILDVQMQIYGLEMGTLVRYVEPTGNLSGSTQSSAFVWGAYGLLMQPKKPVPGVLAKVTSGGTQNPCSGSGSTGLAMNLTYSLPKHQGLKAFVDYSTLR